MLQLDKAITLHFQWEHVWADTQEGAVRTKQKASLTYWALQLYHQLSAKLLFPPTTILNKIKV